MKKLNSTFSADRQSLWLLTFFLVNFLELFQQILPRHKLRGFIENPTELFRFYLPFLGHLWNIEAKRAQSVSVKEKHLLQMYLRFFKFSIRFRLSILHVLTVP